MAAEVSMSRSDKSGELESIRITFAENGAFISKSYAPKRGSKGMEYVPDPKPMLADSKADALKCIAACMDEAKVSWEKEEPGETGGE